jgi:cytochrome d ubiquinol oxidase subunit II
MATVWYVIVALMIVAYVVLDGFDLGAGVCHFCISRNDDERRLVLRAIGPVWDGNEVWLLAAGGTLFFAFPLLYASSFSGFYLPLMMVLWMLMGRGLAVELRSHVQNPVWRGFFDGIFVLASSLLTVFYGAALANVIRGVPLDQSGYFFEPLWTDWRVRLQTGILDWYTVIAGVVAFAALAQHGALYLVTKTEGDINVRARRFASVIWPFVLLLTVASLIATIYVQPPVLENYRAYPFWYLIPVIVYGSLFAMFYFHRRVNDLGQHTSRGEKAAFLCSCIYLAGMLGGAAVANYPNVLRARIRQYSLTIYNTATGAHGLSVGLVWWTIGIVLAIGYFVFVYRMFRGKVIAEEGNEY